MNWTERQFSTETNFERTTDEFWKNVIRSNDLARILQYGHYKFPTRDFHKNSVELNRQKTRLLSFLQSFKLACLVCVNKLKFQPDFLDMSASLRTFEWRDSWAARRREPRIQIRKWQFRTRDRDDPETIRWEPESEGCTHSRIRRRPRLKRDHFSQNVIL